LFLNEAHSCVDKINDNNLLAFDLQIYGLKATVHLRKNIQKIALNRSFRLSIACMLAYLLLNATIGAPLVKALSGIKQRKSFRVAFRVTVSTSPHRDRRDFCFGSAGALVAFSLRHFPVVRCWDASLRT
jgi:hypothetical protein